MITACSMTGPFAPLVTQYFISSSRPRHFQPCSTKQKHLTIQLVTKTAAELHVHWFVVGCHACLLHSFAKCGVPVAGSSNVF